MTIINVRKRNGYIIGFTMEGHAMYNTEGPDILCSALSTAAQMTVEGIKYLTNDAIQYVRTDEERGFIDVVVKACCWTDEAIRILMSSFVHTIEMLQIDYPDNVKLIIKLEIGGELYD